MSRGQGRVFRPKNTVFWWLDYTVGGKRRRESSGMDKRKDALDVLRQRVGDWKSGKLVESPGKIVLAEYLKDAAGKYVEVEDAKGKKRRTLVGGLRHLVERQYRLDENRSGKRLGQAFQQLEAFFGPEARAVDITRSRLDAYAEQRLTVAARSTVNQELAQLRRGFALAIGAGLLAVAPKFNLPKPQNARSGFFSEGELAALLLELRAEEVRDLVQFLSITGWRRDEGRLLTWATVDLAEGTIRLEEARSKSGEPRVFPFRLAPPLTALLERRWAQRNGLYVFHRDGAPLGTGALRSAWTGATKRAGLVGRLVHDLRRTAARDWRRAGLAESDIMELCGWETREMFKRYCIRDEAALAAAVGKRYAPAPTPADANGIVKA